MINPHIPQEVNDFLLRLTDLMDEMVSEHGHLEGFTHGVVWGINHCMSANLEIQHERFIESSPGFESHEELGRRLYDSLREVMGK